MKAKVEITPRADVLDPRGQAVHKALARLGFAGLESVRVGTLVEIEFAAPLDADEARRQVEAMCRALLANQVIEDFRVDIVE